MIKLLPIIAGSGFCLLFFSCSDTYNVCASSVYVAMNSSFYYASSPDPITPASFSVSTIHNAPILSNVTGKSSFAVELDAASDTFKFVLTLPPAVSDTITVAYTSQTHVISADCGSITVHTLSSATSTNHTVDSLKIITPLVNNISAQNLRVYL